MRMTNELEQIMKRRLEKLQDNNDDTSKTDVTLLSPREYGKDANSILPSENNEDQNEDETEARITTNDSSSSDDNLLCLNQRDNKYNDHGNQTDDNEGIKDTLIKNESSESILLHPLPHNQLRGQARLTSVVKYLEKSCPWTASITPLEMLQWLKSELDEIEKELNLIDAWKERVVDQKLVNRDDSLEREEEEREERQMAEYNCLINSLTSEMGDILFDTMMLEMIIRREYKLKENTAYQTASEKVERRTPYMKEWGDGKVVAKTSKDADMIWQEVKKAEKKQAEKSLESSIRVHLEKELGMMNEFNKPPSNKSKTSSQDKVMDNQTALGEVQNNIGNKKVELLSSMHQSDNLFEVKHTTSYNQGNEKIHKSMDQAKTFVSKAIQASADNISPINNEGESLQSSAGYNTSRINNFSLQTNIGIHATLGFAAGSLLMALVQKYRR